MNKYDSFMGQPGRKVAVLVVVPLLVAGLALYWGIALAQTGLFEIDGNTADNAGAPGLDWESVILGGDPDWDAGPGLLIRDGSSGPKAVIDELNIYAKGGKFGVPEDWIIEPGNTPAQNDLTNVYVYPIFPSEVTSDTWMVMGMERIKKQGTFDLDFEYNQVPWDGTSGTLVRTPGDISVGFELSGNPEDPEADLQVLILVYDPANAPCTGWDAVYGAGWCVVFSGPGGALGAFGEATMNGVAFDQPPWGSFQSSGAPLPEDEQVQPFFFAEAAINLSELGIEPGCPGFGSVHAKSRSSLEITADMKDLAGPVALPIQCSIHGYKYKDVNGDGTVPNDDDTPLSGWTIELWDEDGPTFVVSTTTDVNGYYVFGGLWDGTYSVREVCPAGWTQTYPAPTNGCGSGVHSGIVISVSNKDQGPFDFGNAIGSIIIRKEDGDGALLPGAGFTFDPNPFDGGAAIEIDDGSGYDQADGDDGILCIDNVVLATYAITETQVPAGYAGDPDTEMVMVTSSKTCADRLAGQYTPDATFTNELGSIIIRKEDGNGADLAGAGFTFDPNPFDGGAAIEIDDGSAYDQANGDDGILCIDDVLLASYDITETQVPAGYAGDPDAETVVVSSASNCADRLADTYTPDATFTNELGSIIIRKEAKDKSADGGIALLSGAGFTFDPNPFTGGAAIEIDDGSAYDQANGDDGILCIDDVLLATYAISETQVPAGYDGDPDIESAVVSSASTCADRLADTYTPDATFVNVPLSEIEVIFTSLNGYGVTEATITCVDGVGNTMTFDFGTDNEDEIFTDLLPGTYVCTIEIDP